ncbi:MAG: AAA family ATPase [Bacteroidales bacterium]|nr:AAA family ATPase [Bacteroidales bacterium]
MIYLENFSLVSEDMEWDVLRNMTHALSDSFYPFQIFPHDKKLEKIVFADITIFCGSNGSGKSTVLNIIAEKLRLNRETPYNKTDFFDPYIERCGYNMFSNNREKLYNLMKISRIITSDDVFNHIISVRKRNEDKNFKRSLIFDESSDSDFRQNIRRQGFDATDPKSIKTYQDNYEKFKNPVKYIRKSGNVDERTYSNGETGFRYFTDAIQPGGLYLLDEPENSLSAEMQIELMHFLHGMAGRYDCQFIVSTHSPFLLSLPGAKIFNMDSEPVKTCKWTDLPNVRIFFDFFMERKDEF